MSHVGVAVVDDGQRQAGRAVKDELDADALRVDVPVDRDGRARAIERGTVSAITLR
jgi:hypothetical protein